MMSLLILILSTFGLTHAKAPAPAAICTDRVVFVSDDVATFPCNLAHGQVLVLTDITRAECLDVGGRYLATRTGACWDVDF